MLDGRARRAVDELKEITTQDRTTTRASRPVVICGSNLRGLWKGSQCQMVRTACLTVATTGGAGPARGTRDTPLRKSIRSHLHAGLMRPHSQDREKNAGDSDYHSGMGSNSPSPICRRSFSDCTGIETISLYLPGGLIGPAQDSSPGPRAHYSQSRKLANITVS